MVPMHWELLYLSELCLSSCTLSTLGFHSVIFSQLQHFLHAGNTQLVCAGSTKSECKAEHGHWLGSSHGPEGTCPAVTLSAESLVFHVWHCDSVMLLPKLTTLPPDTPASPFLHYQKCLFQSPTLCVYPTGASLTPSLSHRFPIRVLTYSAVSCSPWCSFSLQMREFFMCSSCYTCSSQAWQGSCLLSQLSPISTSMFLCSFYPVFHWQSLFQVDFTSYSTVVPILCSSFPSMSLPKWPWITFSFVSKTLYLHIQPVIPLLYCYNFPNLSLVNFGHFLGVQFAYTVPGSL